ncbi:hypothetical protein BDV24DRAFT_169570 [Aspergillus arachidicola]|uniref:Uncharacterized protein n=1 Tax=Aspergillus arachidicola TaxID=656916 RepID=A0A5N6XRW5_9EURO|nr:hypothetical protein BDV24DRAFT_169570 [Aspergillus arachidicola]
MAVVARIRRVIFWTDPNFLGADLREVGTADIDTALARIWTFFRIFNTHPHSNSDIEEHQCWLAGTSRPLRSVARVNLFNDSLEDPLAHSFALGIKGGLQQHELWILYRRWDLLELELLALIGEHSLDKTIVGVNNISLGLSVVDELLISRRDPWQVVALETCKSRWGWAFGAACRCYLGHLLRAPQVEYTTWV